MVTEIVETALANRPNPDTTRAKDVGLGPLWSAGVLLA